MRRTVLIYQISPICPQLNETNSVNISDITNMSAIKLRRTVLTYQISPICPQLNETNSVNISDISNMSAIMCDEQC